MNNKGFLGLVGLLLTVAIICVLAYFMYKQYMGKPTGMDQGTGQIVNQAGIDTSSAASILDSAKSTIKSAQDEEQKQ